MKCIKLFFIIILTSCAQQKEVKITKIATPKLFIAQGTDHLDTKWWNSFNNKSLSGFVVQGLENNISLKANELRLKSSEIDTSIANSERYPSLSANASASSDFDNFGNVDNVSLGLSSSWEIDLWGGINANINRSHWNLQEDYALYRGRSNLVAGSITNAWLGVITEQEKEQVLAEQYKRTKDALKVITRRFEMGKNSVTNIWQQQRLLKSIEVQQSNNEADLYLYRQTLALWLAVPTDQINIDQTLSLPKLPALPDIGIPAQVLKFRPDVQQAFAKIQAANENLAIALSNQYPRVTLRANYSTSSSSINDLLDDWAGNLIASLAMPLFDSGVLKSVVEQRKLELKALILDYQQVWLEAIASVNQVLINESQLLQIRKNLNQQLNLAKKTEKLTKVKYLSGKTNYLDLLRAQESILSLERQKIDANKRVMTNRVLLYRELSHGDFSLNKQVSRNHIDGNNKSNQGI